MPKAPRATDGTTKKRSKNNNLEGNGATAAVAQSSVASPEPAQEVTEVPAVTTIASPAAQAAPPTAAPALEEQIRVRAYELYLQRGGRGGSPEQDWLQAKQEVCGQLQVA